MATTALSGYAAMAYNEILSQVWEETWISNWAFLAYLKGKNFNRTRSQNWGNRGNLKQVSGHDIKGLQMMLPTAVAGPPVSARVMTQATAATAMTPQIGVTGAREAMYYGNGLENSIADDWFETMILDANPETMYISIDSFKLKQYFSDFSNVIAPLLIGTQNGTGYLTGNGNPTGEQYILSTGNIPGGIDQTVDTSWAALTYPNAGAFGDTLVRSQISAITATGDKRRPTFLQLSYSSTNSPWDHAFQQASSVQLLGDGGDGVAAKYGYGLFSYMGLDCFQDPQLGTSAPGSMVVGTDETWYAIFHTDEPTLAPMGRRPITGTSSMERFYVWFMWFGCRNPGRNSFVSGIYA